MADYSPPSRSQADQDTLAGTFKVVLRKFLQGTDDFLPARVIAYDASKNRVSVQPLIDMLNTRNQRITRAQIASVPVFQLGAGGFVLRFPVKTGDMGWIKASDRDISLFKQSYEQAAPNTLRMHSFEDAIFFPDTLLNGTDIAGEDIENAVLQSLDGTIRLALGGEKIKITSPRTAIGDIEGFVSDDNAVLDVQSITKASFPWPRMTQAQRDAIPSPQEGMAVWNLDTHVVSTFDGGAWS